MFKISMADILQHGWAGKQWAIRGDHMDYLNLEWLDVSAKPSEQEMLDIELVAAKAKMVVAIKWEAGVRILAAYPSWKQSNCALGAYDESTTAAIKSGIASVRSASDAAEVAVAALETVEAVLAYTW